MATSVDSLLDINLSSDPNIGDGSIEDITVALQEIHNAIQILTNEVERIRIATGTPAP